MLPLLAAAGAGLASSAIGAASAANDRDQAARLIAQSLDDYKAMGIPTVEAQKLVLEEFKSAGKLTPELEQTILQGPSAMGEIALDPAYKASQMKALDELESIGSSGGMRLSDTAALNEVMGKINSSNRGSREAILANARDRGVAGGGSELAAQLEAQQSSAQNANQAGTNIAAMAQDRALNAIMSGGELAGKIRGQEYGEKSDAARAADEISRFNTANRVGTQQRNVGSGNDAQRYNLGNDQRIMDANVGMRNTNEARNKDLMQKNFDNQLVINQSKANARAGQASNINAGADRTQQMWGGIGQGVNQIGTQIATNQAADSRHDDYMKLLEEKKLVGA